MNLQRSTENKLHSLSNAARKLGIGKEALYHLISVGKIGVLYIGKRRKIPQSEIQKFIKENTKRYNISIETELTVSDIGIHFLEKEIKTKRKTDTDLFLLKLKEELN